jgi:prepilin-type N-terminal cleavage/methylation domain-containing protein
MPALLKTTKQTLCLAFGAHALAATLARNQKAAADKHVAGVALPRRQPGFTLVELIVSLTIIAVIAAMVSTIILTSTSMTRRTLLKEEYRQIASTQLDFIASRLQLVDSISLTVVADGSNWDVATQVDKQSEALFLVAPGAGSGGGASPHSDGYLYYKRAGDNAGRNIFGDAFYNGLTARLQIKVLRNSLGGGSLASSGPTITITLELINPEGQVVETLSRSLELLNSSPISQKSGSTTGALVPDGTALPPSDSALIIEFTHT